MYQLLILAAEKKRPSTAGIIGMGFAFIAVGTLFVIVGRNDIKTERAEESGSRRLVNDALGNSNAYEGKKAVRLGYVRVIGGVFAILFGLAAWIIGPFVYDWVN